MAEKKEIVVLSGGGHRGIVKIVWSDRCEKDAVCTCNLDFRPNNAVLYLVGDDVAQMALKDISTTAQLPFCVKGEFGCVLRSSSLTMFGGALKRGEITRRVDDFLQNAGAQIEREKVRSAESEQTANSVIQQCERDDNTSVNLDKDSVESPSFDGVAINAFGRIDEWVKYDGNNFYNAVKPQIDELFVCYPREDRLCDLVENSKWVRVQTKDDFYVVGVLYDDNGPAYICYGVPSASGVQPPRELENICVWLPLSHQDGYWVIYQSAQTGEIVKIK